MGKLHFSICGAKVFPEIEPCIVDGEDGFRIPQDFNTEYTEAAVMGDFLLASKDGREFVIAFSVLKEVTAEEAVRLLTVIDEVLGCEEDDDDGEMALE